MVAAAGYGASLSLSKEHNCSHKPYPPLNNSSTTAASPSSSSKMSSFLPRNYQNATMPPNPRSMAAQRLAMLARAPSSSSLRSTDSGGGLKKPGTNRRRAGGVKRCVSFSEERPSIQRIDSVKSLLAEPLDERRQSHQGAAASMSDLWYDSVELETAKDLSAQLVLSIEQGKPIKNHSTSSKRCTAQDEVEDLRGLERHTAEGSWQHFQNRAKALGAVLDTKPQNPDELASLASEATEEARLTAQQRALQDEKEALEYLSDVRDSLSACSSRISNRQHQNNNIVMMVGASDDEISIASSCTEDPLDNDEDRSSNYRYTPGRAASGSSLRGPKSSVGLDSTNDNDHVNPPALRRQVTATYYSKTPPPSTIAISKNSTGSDNLKDKPKVSASSSFSVPRRPVAGGINNNSTAPGSNKPQKVSASASFSVPRRPVGGGINNNSSLLDKPKVSASASFSVPRRPVGGGLAGSNKNGVSKPLESKRNSFKKEEEAQSKDKFALSKQQQKEAQTLAKQQAKLEALKRKPAASKKNADDDASVSSSSSSSSGSSSSSSSSNSSSSSAHRQAQPRVVTNKRQGPPPRSQSTVNASSLTAIKPTTTTVTSTGVLPTRSHSAPKTMLPSTNKLASSAATSAVPKVRKPPQRTSSSLASAPVRKPPDKKPPQRSSSMTSASATAMAASINKKYLPSNTGGRATSAMQRIPRRRPGAASGGED